MNVGYSDILIVYLFIGIYVWLMCSFKCENEY